MDERRAPAPETDMYAPWLSAALQGLERRIAARLAGLGLRPVAGPGEPIVDRAACDAWLSSRPAPDDERVRRGSFADYRLQFPEPRER